MATYWEIPERCRSCRNKHNDGTPMKSNYKCFCLPYWGKEITNDMKCPKDMKDGGTLKSICKVNTEV